MANKTLIKIDKVYEKTVDATEVESKEARQLKKGVKLNKEPEEGKTYWASINENWLNLLDDYEPSEEKPVRSPDTSKQKGNGGYNQAGATEGMCFNNAVQIVLESYRQGGHDPLNAQFIDDVKLEHEKLLSYINGREWEE